MPTLSAALPAACVRVFELREQQWHDGDGRPGDEDHPGELQ